MGEPRLNPKAFGKRMVLFPEIISMHVAGCAKERYSPGLELQVHDAIISQLLPSSYFPS